MRRSVREHRIRGRVWLALAALVGVFTMWLEPRLAVRPQPRKAIAWRDDSAYWGGGAVGSASAHVVHAPAPVAAEASPELRPEPLGVPLPAWPTLDARPSDAAAEANAPSDATAWSGDGDAEVAVDAESHDGDLGEVATTASPGVASSGAAFGGDPNAPLIVPLYTSVPVGLPVVGDPRPTMGGTAQSQGGAGGTSVGLAGGSVVGLAGGTAVGLAGGSVVGLAGGTAVGLAGAAKAPGIAFGTNATLRPMPLLGPFPTPVAIVITPLGWLVVPLR
jgi:hypothetical protein